MTWVVAAALTVPSFAATLYEQEGTAADGYAPINAAGHGPASNPNSTNWQYAYGGVHSWTGVYSWGTGWVENVPASDDTSNIDIEADIELFASTSITDPNRYFHFGNVANATSADKTCYINGTLASNNGEWVGLTFPTTGIEGNMTHVTTDGIVDHALRGTTDGRTTPASISAESFPARFMMTWGAGYQLPGTFGDGADNTIHNSLWWDVNSHTPGSYNLTWRIELMPTAYQPDGNYKLDPVVAVAPAL